MTWKHQSDEPFPEQAAALRSLGEVPAPEELRWRVSLALNLDEEAEAPDELWKRVAPEVRRITAPPRRILAFPGRLAAAAGILVVAGLGLLGVDAWVDDPATVTALSPREAVKDFFRDRVTAIEVAPGQLSPLAHDLAAMAGAPQDRGGS